MKLFALIGILNWFFFVGYGSSGQLMGPYGNSVLCESARETFAQAIKDTNLSQYLFVVKRCLTDGVNK